MVPTPSGCCVSVLRLLVLIEVALDSCRRNLFLHQSIYGTWSYVSWGLWLFFKSHKRFDDSLSSERGSDILIARNIDRSEIYKLGCISFMIGLLLKLIGT